MIQTERQTFYHWSLAKDGLLDIGSLPIYDMEIREHFLPQQFPRKTYQFVIDENQKIFELAASAGQINFNGLLLNVQGLGTAVAGSGRVILYTEAIPHTADEHPVHPERRGITGPVHMPNDPPPKKEIDWFALNKQMAGK